MKKVKDLQKGDHFQLKKRGKWYTVHAHVQEHHYDGIVSRGHGDRYTIAVNNKTLYAFDDNTTVFSFSLSPKQVFKNEHSSINNPSL